MSSVNAAIETYFGGSSYIFKKLDRKRMYMVGNGDNVYDLITDLTTLDDIRLTALSEFIWIGVIEKMNPSPPVPRRRTACYSRRPVYLFKGRRIFSIVRDYEKNEFDFYYIPDDELVFIEKSRA